MGVKENSVKLYITLYTCLTVFLSNTPGKCSPDRRYYEWSYTRQIAAAIENDLPGLMGFGVTSLKNMRKFYEAWVTIEDKSATAVADLQNTENETIVASESPENTSDTYIFRINGS